MSSRIPEARTEPAQRPTGSLLAVGTPFTLCAATRAKVSRATRSVPPGRTLAEVSEPADPDARLLAVEVTAVRYRVPDGDFAVLSGLTEEGDEVTVTGPLAHLQTGESAEVGGQWRRHAKHGWQFTPRRSACWSPCPPRR